MPDSLPINLQDAVAFLEISAETWRKLLEHAGEQKRLNGEPVTFDRLRASILSDPPNEEFLDALVTIHELGTDEGQNLILAAAEDQQVKLDQLADVPAREFSAQVWILSRSITALREVLARARVNLFEAGQPRTYREFAPRTERIPLDFDKEQLKAAVLNWYQDRPAAEVVNVFPFEREGEWYCEIIKGEPPKRVVVVRNESLAILNFKPAASDVIRYDPQTGRIGIASRSPRLIQAYRQLLGNLIANDEQFFSNENICSLRELQNRGRKLFDRPFSGIVRVDVIDLLWRRGDRDRVSVRGRDCFQILSDLGAELHEGELIEAKLKIAFAGGGRHGHVSLKVPNRIDINAGINRTIVEKMLDEVGIRGSFEGEEDRRNFWDLYPWRMPAADFRRQLPHDFDRLVKERIIRPATLERVTHPDHPAAKDALRVVNLDAERTIGMSDDPAIPQRTLTPSDIAGYELDFGTLARAVTDSLDLSGGRVEITNGLWYLGLRELAPAIGLSVFLAIRRPQEATSALIKERSSGARPVLLIPKGCASAITVPTVICPLPSGPYESLLGSIIEQLGLQDQVEPYVYTRADLVIDLGRGLAWFRGTTLSELKLNTHPFKFVTELAKTPGRVVLKGMLNEALSVSRTDDEVAKQAKSKLLKAIKSSFASAGIAQPPEIQKIVIATGGGYVLQVSARVLPSAGIPVGIAPVTSAR